MAIQNQDITYLIQWIQKVASQVHGSTRVQQDILIEEGITINETVISAAAGPGATGNTSVVTNNGDGTFSHDDGTGNVVVIDTRRTTVADNGGGSYTITDDSGNTVNFSTTVADASETTKGIIEIASDAEAILGLDSQRAMTSRGTRLYVDQVIIYNNGALSGAAPNKAEIGVDSSTGAIYYVNAGNWSPVPTATVDLNTTVSDQTGANGTGNTAPVAGPATPDVGDLHIEIYDDVNIYFTATATNWTTPAIVEVARDLTSFADSTTASNNATGSGGTASTAARSDHKHAAQGISADVGNLLEVGTDGLHFLGTEALDSDSGTNLIASDRTRVNPEGLKTIVLGATPVDGTTAAYFIGQLFWDNVNKKLYEATAKSTDPDAAGTGSTFAEVKLSGTGITEWVAAKVYETDVIVITPGKALVKRIAGGTSTTQFDATEAANWTYISDLDSNKDWTASTYYYSGQGVKVYGGRYLERDIAGYTPASFDDVSEVNKWILINQAAIQNWSSGKNIVEKQKVYVENGVFKSINVTGLSSATFDLDVANYNPEEVDSSFKSLFWSEAFEANSGSGYSTMVVDQTTGGYGLKCYDTDGAVVSVFVKDFKEVFSASDSYQIRAIVGKKASAQSAILRYTDGASNTAEVKIRLNTGALLTNTALGNVTLSATSKSLTRGSDGAYQIDMIMTMTGAVGGNFGTIQFIPVLNTDGSTVADASATGDAELLDIQVGAASEFLDEGIETVRLDSSGGVVALTLDAASGTGNSFLYTIADKTNTITIDPQAGEAINSSTDGTFYPSNFEVGTTFLVTDRSAGNWDIAVVGASLELERIPTTHIEGAIVDSVSNDDNDFEILDIDALITETTNTDYNVDIANNSFGTGFSIDAASNGLIIPAGRWTIEFDLEHPATPLTGGGSVQLDVGDFAAVINVGNVSTNIDFASAISWQDSAGLPEKATVTHDVYFTQPTKVFFGFRGAVDAADNEAFAVRIDVYSNEPKEVVLAGMVSPTELSHARFTLSANSALSQVCPFDEGQGDVGTIINDGAGNITIPVGKWRIQVGASRVSAVCDYTLWNVTDNVALENYTSKDVVDAVVASPAPYYLTVTTPTVIQVRETGLSASISWAGRQTNIDGDVTNAIRSFTSFIDIQQLPNSTVVLPDAVPVEDVEVLLDEQTIGNGGTLTIPADLSAYEYLRFEAVNRGASNVAVSEVVKVSNLPNSRLAMHHDDATGYIYFDINGTGTVATLGVTGSFTGTDVCRVIGIKAQKTVINTVDTPTNMTEVGTAISPSSTKKYSLQWNGNTIVNTLTYEYEDTINGKFECNHLTGVLKQWGTITDGGSDNDVVINLPVPFLNTSYSVVVTVATAGEEYAGSARATTVSTFTLNRNDSAVGTADWNWQAIGLKP